MSKGMDYNEYRVDDHNKIFTISINGKMQRQFKTYDDSLYNDNGPADIEYYDNGKIKRIAYFKSIKHQFAYNDNGPAIIEYYENGNEKYVMYNTREGIGPHRLNGPAVTFYYSNKDIKEEFYYLNGEIIEDELKIEMLKSYISERS